MVQIPPPLVGTAYWVNPILPTDYTKLSPAQRRQVRLRYIKLQNGTCIHCGQSLKNSPSKLILGSKINWELFPPDFEAHPIHLHHNHLTGMTVGAVHMRCNAYLFQYKGE